LNLIWRSATFLLLLISWISAAAIEREAFTFTNYNLQITVDPSRPFLGVTGKVVLRNDSSTPQRIAVLQISSSLDWSSITVAGKPVQYVDQRYTSDIDHTGALSEAIVTLPREVPPKGTVELQIGYEGAVPQDATRLERVGTPRQIAAANEWDRISATFTAVRGVGYVTWYPVAMEAASLSSGREFSEVLGKWKQRHIASQLTADFFAPGSLQIYANGASKTPVREELGALPYHLVTSYTWTHFGLDVPVFVIASYRQMEKPTLIRYLEGHQDLANRNAQIAAEVGWFSSARRERFQIVELPEQSAVPFSSGPVLFTPFENLPPKELEVSLAYARSHADVRSLRLWIYEGIASAAQAFQREKQEGRGAAISLMESRRGMLIEIEKSSHAPVPASDSSQPPSNAATSLTASADELLARTKGLYVWWMLRDMLGERVLQKAMQKYQPEQDTEPAYMQRLLEAEARAAAPQATANLEQFFDDWVYRDRGLPDFRIDSVYARQMLGSGFLVTVTVENLGGAGAEVPVIARGSNESETRRLWVPGRQKASVRIPLRSQPLEAQVNDGSVPETDVTNNTFEVRLESSP
jgi:hypothetical protein